MISHPLFQAFMSKSISTLKSYPQVISRMSRMFSQPSGKSYEITPWGINGIKGRIITHGVVFEGNPNATVYTTHDDRHYIQDEGKLVEVKENFLGETKRVEERRKKLLNSRLPNNSQKIKLKI